MPSKNSSLPVILSIVGPTASGKTALALQTARTLLTQNPQEVKGVDLISADSRQIYRQFEILSGADLGEFRSQGFNWQKRPDIYDYPFLAPDDNSIRFHGATILDFPTPWSLALFHDFATRIIKHAHENERRVILVGGTMLYHDRLFANNDTISVPPNSEVREKAVNMTVTELQNWLRQLDQNRLTALNNSDLHNPRRLLRQIEISLHNSQTHDPQSSLPTSDSTHSTLPLNSQTFKNQHEYLMPKYDLEKLKAKIAGRVRIRFQTGAVREVERILQKYGNDLPHVGLPLGFQEIKAYLAGEVDQNETLNLWALHEWQYAKRQLTWWRSKNLIPDTET